MIALSIALGVVGLAFVWAARSVAMAWIARDGGALEEIAALRKFVDNDRESWGNDLAHANNRYYEIKKRLDTFEANTADIREEARQARLARGFAKR